MKLIDAIKEEFSKSPVATMGAVVALATPIIAIAIPPARYGENLSNLPIVGMIFLTLGIGFGIAVILGRFSVSNRLTSYVYCTLGCVLFCVSTSLILTPLLGQVSDTYRQQDQSLVPLSLVGAGIFCPAFFLAVFIDNLDGRIESKSVMFLLLILCYFIALFVFSAAAELVI